MTPLETLLARKSHNKLISPAPSKEQLETMMQAALRAPDHALLKPWRYQVFCGESLNQLGELFAKISLLNDPDLSQGQLDRIKLKPLRAPMVVVSIVKIVEHKKVPEVEQILSAGASAQNLIMAAHFMNVGAIWRTGDLAFNRLLMNELGLAKNESITGFIYLGHEDGDKRPVPIIDSSDFVEWV
jgi:nitroreductase